MKFKELFVLLTLALLTTVGLQYFFSSNKGSDVTEGQPISGQKFQAPKASDLQVHLPLNTEVDFLDKKVSGKAILTEFKTEHARYVFTTLAGSLQELEFRRNWGGTMGYLCTICSPSVLDREQRCFLVALNEKTPYGYDLVGNKDEQDRFIITYKAETDQATIIKEYEVLKGEFRVNLNLTVNPKNQPVQARIIFPSPSVPELGNKDIITGLANDMKNKVQMLPMNEELLNEYWSRPTLFGAQDRYFIHAMVSDRNYFVQRGYFKIVNFDTLYSILEGPEVSEKTTWSLSFYMGPKEDDAIALVDPRLEATLNYGMLAFISRPVSKIMLDILNFLYGFLKNYGLAIIVLTILMRLIMIPFTLKADQGMAKQGELQKKMKHAEQKYKNDPEALTQARAELIRKHGMPGLGSCLPMFFQIPLFIALSWVLSNSIELYMAPFLWISDLSGPDPYYILPALFAVSMILTALAGDPKQRMAPMAIGLIFAVFMTNFASGLVLYIVVSTLLGAVQTFIMKKK